MSLCAVCRMPSRGFGYRANIAPKNYPVTWFCSKNHTDTWINTLKQEGGYTVNQTQDETSARKAALMAMGQQVASIGMQKPLAEYTAEEAKSLVEAVLAGYQGYFRSLTTPPF